MKLFSRYMLAIIGLVIIVSIFLTKMVLWKTERYSQPNHFDKYQQFYSQLRKNTSSKQKWEFLNKKNITENSSQQSRLDAGNSGNPLIYNYGKNNLSLKGENGREVILAPNELEKADRLSKEYNINVFISDLIPLNRIVPDSRPTGCSNQVFDESNMPQVAVIIPVHNEWPSILLRTIYSIINRTPRHLLKEIILVDDNSDLESLKEDLDIYIKEHFDKNLVKVIRLEERTGLIKARVEAFKYITAEVACIFDSHMEVNIDWLQPLLVEIMKNRSTVAMAQLDYINSTSFMYNFDRNYTPRYGFNWDLEFFETYFRPDQMLNKKITDPLPGPVMVGSGFAIDVEFFRKIGLYDTYMKIWGGENLELSWRVWSCGGQVIHAFCSHIGHIARPQPYDFPGGRTETQLYNYKRAVDVWFGPYKKYIYSNYPLMKDLDVGDISDRLKLKEELKCKNFDWYLDNVWPELFRFDVNVTATGELRNIATKDCLDNGRYLFPVRKRFYAEPCNNILLQQGFSLTHQKWLRTTLQCVSADCVTTNLCFAVLKDCFDGRDEKWEHKDGFMKHINTGLCLDLEENKSVILRSCNNTRVSQRWNFTQFHTLS